MTLSSARYSLASGQVGSSLLLVNLKANNSGVKNGASFFQSFGNPEEQNNPTSLQSYVNSNRNGTSPSDSNDFKRTNTE